MPYNFGISNCRDSVSKYCLRQLDYKDLYLFADVEEQVLFIVDSSEGLYAERLAFHGTK